MLRSCGIRASRVGWRFAQPVPLRRPRTGCDTWRSSLLTGHAAHLFPRSARGFEAAVLSYRHSGRLRRRGVGFHPPDLRFDSTALKTQQCTNRTECKSSAPLFRMMVETWRVARPCSFPVMGAALPVPRASLPVIE